MKVQVKYVATKKIKEMDERYAVILAKLGKVEILPKKKNKKDADKVEQKKEAPVEPVQEEQLAPAEAPQEEQAAAEEEQPDEEAQEDLGSLA